MHARLRPETIARLQLVAALLVIGGCAALFAFDAFVSPRVAFLRPDPRAAWIQAPARLTPAAQSPNEKPTRFETRFALEEVPISAALLLRVVGEARVAVNGSVISGEPALPSSGKREVRLPVADHLRSGENVIAVDVERRFGPALLWLAGEGLPNVVASGPAWQVARGERAFTDAVVADDTRPLPEARSAPSSLDELAPRAPVLAGLFAAASLAAGLVLRARGFAGAHAPRLVLAAVIALWAIAFVRNVADMPLLAGFDVPNHFEYVQWLRRKGSVPLASEGWSFYHPPLFYWLAAALVPARGPLAPGSWEVVALRLLTWLPGLGMVLASAAVARRVHRDAPNAQAFAIAIAGLLPMTLYLSGYFSNESASACLLALAMALAVRSFDVPRPPAHLFVALGLVFAAALLTKYTAVLVLPVLLLFLGVRLALDARVSFARAGLLLGVVVATPLALAGWLYLRNALALGTPLPTNWGEDSASVPWWQQPGFHTARWYLRFGESLVHPWFAGFASFWDAIYATLWGDGYFAGRTFAEERIASWDHGWMAATYPVALPATALLGFGIARSARRSLSEPSPGRRLSLALLATLAFVLLAALADVSLRYPSYAQVKAFYVLPIAVPIAVLGADGFAAVDRRLARLRSVVPRALYLGACITFAAMIAMTYAG